MFPGTGLVFLRPQIYDPFYFVRAQHSKQHNVNMWIRIKPHGKGLFLGHTAIVCLGLYRETGNCPVLNFVKGVEAVLLDR